MLAVPQHALKWRAALPLSPGASLTWLGFSAPTKGYPLQARNLNAALSPATDGQGCGTSLATYDSKVRSPCGPRQESWPCFLATLHRPGRCSHLIPRCQHEWLLSVAFCETLVAGRALCGCTGRSTEAAGFPSSGGASTGCLHPSRSWLQVEGSG